MNNQDLCQTIVGLLDPDGRGTLCNLARLNKTFFHASTDTIWKNLPSVEPALRLLPLCSEADVSTVALSNMEASSRLLSNSQFFTARGTSELGRVLATFPLVP